jgi:predicted ATPase
MSTGVGIRTPDQRLRVFVSSTLDELARERTAVRHAIESLRLVPVMFELGARPHPPRELYRAYLEQSQVFVGIYWQRYGWVAPGSTISGLEDEYLLAGDRPCLVYIKHPAPDRDADLTRMLESIRDRGRSSYKRFTSTDELRDLVQQDLAILLTERFEATADPTLPTGGSAPASPPVPLTSLVGRRQELAAVTQLLERGARLVTLTGTGGIGKTRLALAVAAEVAGRFPDGVHFVPLSSVESAEHLLPTIAARLQLRLSGPTDAVSALYGNLARRQALLVLDNLEQIRDAAPVIIELLERCPELQVLATSRRSLKMVGEQEWPLDPLDLADRDEALEAIARSPAVQLFVERARAADPRFTLGEHNASEVATLCHRLDGLPLAIELAAARTRLLPAATLLQRLGDRLELLAAGAERPERQRTLRATIDWSARLLTEAELAGFARLSVFRGGCTLSAAEQVCDLDGRDDVLGIVGTLLDNNLVTIDHDSDDEPRVRMLETVRHDAAARLASRGEIAEVRQRHLAWYASLADTAQPFLCGPEQVRWMAKVEAERENLRVAARTAVERSEFGVLLEMAWDLYLFYYLRGAQTEPERWVRDVAEQSDELDERQRAIITTALAISALWRGETDEVADRLERALETFVRGGFAFEAAVAQMHLGLSSLESGRWAQAAERERAAITRFASVHHDWGVGSCENLLGIAMSATGDLDGARSCHERARDKGRRIGNVGIEAQALTLLAANALDRNELATARSLLDEAIPLLVLGQDATGASGCLEVLAATALAADDPERALTALAVADATRRHLETPLNTALRRRVDRLVDAVAGHVGDRFPERWAAAGDADPFRTLRDLGETLARDPVR